MKQLILAFALLATVANAGEVKIYEATGRFSMNRLEVGFVASELNQTAAVNVTVLKPSRRENGPIYRRTTTRVPVEGLSVVNNTVVFDVDGRLVECGTLEKTPILRQTVVKTTGECKIIKRIKGRKLEIFIKAD